VECYIAWANQGSWTGATRLYGLPFTSANAASYPAVLISYKKNVDFKGGTDIDAYVSVNSTFIVFKEVNSDSSLTALVVGAFDDISNNELMVSATYTV
jgi:hypothetical protein